MSVPDAKWEEAMALLQQFERQVIAPEYFNWSFITNQLGISKPTLWRNKAFEREFQRVKDIVRNYKSGAKSFDQLGALAKNHAHGKDEKIRRLKEQVEDLTRQLARERERLIYAALIARRRNIDPAEFMQNTPVIRVSKTKDKVTNIEKSRR